MANWRLKANNLRKIYRRLSEYYTDQLGAELTPEWLIDTSRIGKIRGFVYALIFFDCASNV